MKTNKQKCIEMWEWLAENPEKSKYDFLYLLNNPGLARYNQCYACLECNNYCYDCPVTWHKKTKTGQHKLNACFNLWSPYMLWCTSKTLKQKQNAAKKIINLIKLTWKEKKNDSIINRR